MIAAAVRRSVRDRADSRCEYCRTRQADEPFISFQVEHVIAIQHRGGGESVNLALACSHCNLHKGPNLAGIDPVTGNVEVLYHPRNQSWPDHFESRDAVIVGLTPCGRTTVRVLAMNAPARTDLRRQVLQNEGE